MRYYLYAPLIDDYETFSMEDSIVPIQDSVKSSLWVPKPQSIYLESLKTEISINWESDFYNYYYCDFEYGDEAFKEYVEKLLNPLIKQKTFIMNGKKSIVYTISKELN